MQKYQHFCGKDLFFSIEAPIFAAIKGVQPQQPESLFLTF